MSCPDCIIGVIYLKTYISPTCCEGAASTGAMSVLGRVAVVVGPRARAIIRSMCSPRVWGSLALAAADGVHMKDYGYELYSCVLCLHGGIYVLLQIFLSKFTFRN